MLLCGWEEENACRGFPRIAGPPGSKAAYHPVNYWLLPLYYGKKPTIYLRF